MSSFPDLELLGPSELASLFHDLAVKFIATASAQERAKLRRQILGVARELLRREEPETTLVLPPDFDEPGGTGVREPRRPCPQTDRDGIALPEPRPADA